MSTKNAWVKEFALINGEMLFPEKSLQNAKSLTLPNLLRNREAVTVLGNLSHFGYTLSLDGVATLAGMSRSELADWWGETEGVLQEVTKTNRKMEKFVVYQNFPAEVLNMSQAEYWAKQILMYLSFPVEMMREAPKDRKSAPDLSRLKVLAPRQEEGYVSKIWDAMVGKLKAFTDAEEAFMKNAVREINPLIDVSRFGLRQNGVKLASLVIGDPEAKLRVNDATDVLRIVEEMRTVQTVYGVRKQKVSLPKAVRRRLVSLLDGSAHLEKDAAMNSAKFKNLFRVLHPGDFKSERVMSVYNSLYNSELKSENAVVENALRTDADSAFEAASGLPAGNVMRRFHKLYSVDAERAVALMEGRLSELSTERLAGFMKYVETVNAVEKRLVAPKGNWEKLQIVDNDKVKISDEHIARLTGAIGDVLRERLSVMFPYGVRFAENAEKLNDVKLPVNSQELAEYGPGTKFDVPENHEFYRTASYWEQKAHGSVWFDNGFIFVSDDFKESSALCWNSTSSKFGVFSGDPVNSQEMRGRACQMIDVYPKKAAGDVRYAMWNVLAFSHIMFKDATEVLATMQTGEDPEQGRLYEPSKARFVFPLKGDSLSKYVALIDFKENKLIFVDMNLGGTPQSAASNQKRVKEFLPHLLTYMENRPSVMDVLRFAPQSPDGVVIAYDDADETIRGGAAYVFQPVNSDNDFERVSIRDVMSAGDGSKEFRAASPEEAPSL